MGFKEELENTRKLINSSLTKESSKEYIDFIGEVSKSLDKLGETHSKTEEDYTTLKGDYIELVKSSGSKDNLGNGDNPPKKEDLIKDDKALSDDLKNFLDNERKGK